ncbi:hypothetical protein MNBD_GAMMA09-725 [hydrothermal vent metagenome]|uniref:Uncharacterized protein n=1 Tax=hydrothermal vent metagenome TaxID=652676 RepID=A0A3B0XYI9_9ZZZZ
MGTFFNSLLFLVVFPPAALAESAQANKSAIQLPSIVGPNIYELYTDAHYFVTRVYVNDKELKLSNAEGNGSTRGRGFSFSGPMGYQNKLILNGHMRTGLNRIKVVFQASSILDDARKEDIQNIVIRDMYAHALIVRGRLTTSSMGVESYDLDKLLQSEDLKVKVLKNQLLRRFNEKKLSQEVSVSYQFKLPVTEKALQVGMDSCSLSFDGYNDFKATLSLNGQPVKEIKGNSSRGVKYFSDVVKSGLNSFHLKVTSVKNKTEKNKIRLYLSCDLKSFIKKINFAKEHKSLDFGDFFKSVYVPLVNIEFTEKGEYSSDFNMEL